MVMVVLVGRLPTFRRKHQVNGKLQRVVNHPREKHFQKAARFFKARIGVHFNEPRFKPLINDEVITEKFHAVFPILRVDLPFNTLYCISDNACYFAIDKRIQVAFDAIFLEKGISLLK